ncbi:hypothetical protein [Alkalithermobacter paradoxus]|uniref:hypothetical protein n=1 Tax=Alkalithermobacter paradoxus TaxID=29349 RepID=UPI00118078F0
MEGSSPISAVKCIETEVEDGYKGLVQLNDEGEAVIYVGFDGFDEENNPIKMAYNYYLDDNIKITSDYRFFFFDEFTNVEYLLRWKQEHDEYFNLLYDLTKNNLANLKYKEKVFNSVKFTWISEFGSEELKARLNEGHNVDENYIFERLVEELPDFDVYYGSQLWQEKEDKVDRKHLVEVKKLRRSGYDAKIVEVIEVYEEDDFFGIIPIKTKDAIVIENYLDKVALVKYI